MAQKPQWDKCPSGTNVSVGQMSSGTKVPVGQMSKWDKCLSGTNVQWDKCPVGQMSCGTNVSGTTVSGTNVCRTNVTPPSNSQDIFKSQNFSLLNNFDIWILALIKSSKKTQEIGRNVRVLKI